jgi:hypothetical protein
MGCNCGGAKEKANRVSSLIKAKQIVRQMWENTNKELNKEKTVTVKKVNNKLN